MDAGPPEGESAARPGAGEVADARPEAGADADRSVRVSVPSSLAEEAGAILMDVLGPFEEEPAGGEAQPGEAAPGGPRPSGAQPCELPDRGRRSVLVFYPPADGPSTREDLLALLPAVFAEPGVLDVEAADVSREWVEGWREHFRPIVIGRVRVRPPWEAPVEPPAAGGGPCQEGGTTGAGLIDVVVNPGLGFGTGLHPTTRGTLLLLQEGFDAAGRPAESSDLAGRPAGTGPLVDVGTGSGILAIAAAKLGWAPVVALDNDPAALISARENVNRNGVENEVEIRQADTDSAEEGWFREATVLANMTLEPVSLLLRRLATFAAVPRRLVVSGILAGSQEEQIMLIAYDSGFAPRHRLYEEEWVSFELLPKRAAT
jgi:ribosomal protein L11 methyltransferase